MNAAHFGINGQVRGGLDVLEIALLGLIYMISRKVMDIFSRNLYQRCSVGQKETLYILRSRGHYAGSSTLYSTRHLKSRTGS